MGGGLQHLSCDAEARTSLLMAVKTRKRSAGGFSQLPECGVAMSRDTAVRTSVDAAWRLSRLVPELFLNLTTASSLCDQDFIKKEVP